MIAGEVEALQAAEGMRRVGSLYHGYRVVGEVHVAEAGALGHAPQSLDAIDLIVGGQKNLIRSSDTQRRFFSSALAARRVTGPGAPDADDPTQSPADRRCTALSTPMKPCPSNFPWQDYH